MRAMPRFLLVVSLLACLPAAAAAQMVVHTVSLATDGSGDQTVYTRTTFGRVVAVRYVPDATDPMDSGLDITITDNGTGLQVLAVTDIGTSARDFWPRAFSVTTTGTVATYDGTNTVLDLVPIAGALKIVVDEGGASNEGELFIYVEGR